MRWVTYRTEKKLNVAFKKKKKKNACAAVKLFTFTIKSIISSFVAFACIPLYLQPELYLANYILKLVDFEKKLGYDVLEKF